MKRVIRDPEGQIKWILFTVYAGVYYWLSKEGQNKMLELDEDNIGDYYSGTPEDEVESLKEDLGGVLMGDIPKEKLMLSIARSTGLINWQEDVLETNGNPT